MFQFGEGSKNNLDGVHPRLIMVAIRAIQISEVDFGIGSTSVRTQEEQDELIKQGKSKTRRSRHVPENNKCKLSCAIDVVAYVNGKVTWSPKAFKRIVKAFIKAAIELGIEIEFGGLWSSFEDWPHIQLSWEGTP